MKSLRESADAFVLQAAVDELFVAHKQGKAVAVKANTEVFRFGAHLFKNVFEEQGFLAEDFAEFNIIEATRLVEEGKLLAERNALLPASAAIEVFDDLE